MSDLSLDDLIKKDKNTSKMNYLKNKLIKRKQNYQGHYKIRQTSGEGKTIFKKSNQKINDRRKDKGFRKNKDYEKNNNKTKQINQTNDRIVKTLKVLGLSPEITNEDLYKIFTTQGALQKCFIEQDNFGRNLPTALVKYYQAQCAASAIKNINGHKMSNCIFTVEPYKRNTN